MTSKNVSTRSPNANWSEQLRRNPDIAKGLKALTEMKESVALEMAKQIAENRRIDFNEFSAKHGVNSELARIALKGLMLYGQACNQAGDVDILLGVGEIQRQELITKADAASIKKLLTRIKKSTSFFDALEEQIATSEAQAFAFPRLEGIWTRCTAIALFEPEYRASDNPEQYRPTFKGLTPAVVVQLDVSRFGAVDRLSMGLSPEELDRLINRLTLARIQLNVMTRDLLVERNQ